MSIDPWSDAPIEPTRCRNCKMYTVTCGGRCKVAVEPNVEPLDEPEHYALPAKELKELGLWEEL